MSDKSDDRAIYYTAPMSDKRVSYEEMQAIKCDIMAYDIRLTNTSHMTDQIKWHM